MTSIRTSTRISMSRRRLLLLFLCTAPAFASPKAPPETKSATPEFKAPCAVVKNHEGVVRILDSTRTQLIGTEPQTGVPCGSWVSIEDGWIELKHQNGPTLHLGPHSFAQLTAPHGDQVVLFRGQIYAKVADGNPEFRMVSQVGRARVKKGKVILVADHVENETQLIVLENTASLENRFQTSRKVAVRSGEASSLHFKLMRVIPSSPAAVSVASLKPKLVELQVPDKVQDQAIEFAMNRHEKSILPHPETPMEGADENHAVAHAPSINVGSRTLASKSAPQAEPQAEIERESKAKEESNLQKTLIEKTTGGAPVSRGILFPDPFYGKTQKIHVHLEEPQPSKKFRYKKQEEEEAEKKRLMNELSRIRTD